MLHNVIKSAAADKDASQLYYSLLEAGRWGWGGGGGGGGGGGAGGAGGVGVGKRVKWEGVLSRDASQLYYSCCIIIAWRGKGEVGRSS